MEKRNAVNYLEYLKIKEWRWIGKILRSAMRSRRRWAQAFRYRLDSACGSMWGVSRQRGPRGKVGNWPHIREMQQPDPTWLV
jgi:hypothetical protein